MVCFWVCASSTSAWVTCAAKPRMSGGEETSSTASCPVTNATANNEAARSMDSQDSFGVVEVEFVVEPNYAGWRLDRYLCEKIRRLSRARVQRIIRKDLLSERPLKASTLVQPGLM